MCYFIEFEISNSIYIYIYIYTCAVLNLEFDETVLFTHTSKLRPVTSFVEPHKFDIKEVQPYLAYSIVQHSIV